MALLQWDTGKSAEDVNVSTWFFSPVALDMHRENKKWCWRPVHLEDLFGG